MDMPIPDTPSIRAALLTLPYSRIDLIAKNSDVPLTTLWKVRSGETKNPGLETVRKFWPHLKAATEEAKAA